MIFEGVG